MGKPKDVAQCARAASCCIAIGSPPRSPASARIDCERSRMQIPRSRAPRALRTAMGSPPPRSPIRCRNSSRRRDFPLPAGAMTSTVSARGSLMHRSKIARSVFSSSSRPTYGVGTEQCSNRLARFSADELLAEGVGRDLESPSRTRPLRSSMRMGHAVGPSEPSTPELRVSNRVRDHRLAHRQSSSDHGVPGGDRQMGLGLGRHHGERTLGRPRHVIGAIRVGGEVTTRAPPTSTSTCAP